MDENILRQVENKLNLKYYATNKSWLRDCIEYYLSEHNNPKDTEVLEFVISQWQLSDLREICNEKPCLPANLDREKCTTLQGRFILQMDKVYDISEPKYKQIGKIRKLTNDNVEVTDMEKTQAVWEPKKRRMLRLQLTDGAQDIIGIEYQPIRFLNDTLLPGYKLLIKGPVTCRRGIIMLDETNVEEIGGEVANLLVPNALENVLARALNLPENPDPYRDNDDSKMDEDDLFDDDFDIDIDDVAVIETDERRVEISNVTIDEQPVVNRDDTIDREINEQPTESLVSRTESDIFFDDIDDMIFDEAEIIDSAPKLQTRATVVSENLPLPRTTVKDSVKINEPVVKLPKPSSSASKVAIFDKNLEIATSSNNTSMESRSTFPSSFDVESNVCPTERLSGLTIDAAESDSTNFPKKTTKPEVSPVKTSQTTTTRSNKRTAAVLSTTNSVNSPSGKMHCPKTATVPKTSKNNRKITDYMTKTPETTTPMPSTTKICDTVSDLLNASVIDKIVHKTIRGKVDKFDNLSRNGQLWQLNATIIDDTGSIDTTFSSEILESMLGFSVAEFSKKRKLKKTDPNMEDYLRQGFRSAEKKLSQLDDLMEVELAPNKKPKVVKIIERK